jgi:hypothetical protein
VSVPLVIRQSVAPPAAVNRPFDPASLPADYLSDMGTARRGSGTGRRCWGVAAALIAASAIVAFSAPAAIAAATSAASPSASAKTAAPAPDSATFGIGPSNGKGPDGRSFFNFVSSPGGQVTDNVIVRNISAQPLTLRLYAVDAVSGADGSIGYAPASQAPTDAGSWLTLAKANDVGTVTLPAQSAANVPFLLKVPASASPGDHLGGLIVSLTSKVNSGKNSENFEQRVATRVNIRVSGAIVARLSVNQMHASYSPGFVVNPFGSGNVKVSYRVTNTGNVVLGGRQAVNISGWYGGSAPAKGLPDIPQLLPGASTVVTTTIRGVKPGLHLTATAQVTPIPPPNAIDPGFVAASSSVSFWSIPWLAPIVFLLLIGGIGFSVWRRRHRPKPTSGRHGKGGGESPAEPNVPVSHSSR